MRKINSSFTFPKFVSTKFKMENQQENLAIGNDRSPHDSSVASGSNTHDDPMSPLNAATLSPPMRDSQPVSTPRNEDNSFVKAGSGNKIILYTVSENGELQPYQFVENISHPNVIKNNETPEVNILTSPSNTQQRYVNLKIAAEMVPNFDGKMPPVLSFSRDCKFAEQAVHPGDRPFLTKLIRTRIKGDADLFLQNNTEFDSLDTMLEALKTTFSPQRDLSQLQAEMSNILQDENESVSKYGLRVSELLHRTTEVIEQGFPSKAKSGMLLGACKNSVACFVRGLNEKIEVRMSGRNFETLQLAIRHAVKIESEMNCLNFLRSSRDAAKESTERCKRQNRYKFENVDDYVREIRRINKIEGSLTPENDKKRGMYSGQGCFRCGNYGHYKRDCPENKFPRRRPDVGRFLRKCSYCNGPNHTEDNCFLKRAVAMEKDIYFRKRPRTIEKDKMTDPKNYERNPGSSKHVGSFAPSIQQKKPNHQ